MYLCTPGNPQGAMASVGYLREAIQLARRHDFLLVVDECYAEIYNGAPPPGGLQACLAMDETGGRDPFRNVAVFHSLSKRSSAAGLRSGFVAGDPRIVQMMIRWKTYGGTQIPLAIQSASTALWNEDPHAQGTRAFYRRNFEVAQSILHNRFRYFTPAGGFFLWLDVGDGEAATRKLWQQAHVKVLPGGYLAHGTGDQNPARSYIRVALVHDEATTREALGRLAQVL
jgi:aspartate/methionine/tyrosine aminotransferase